MTFAEMREQATQLGFTDAQMAHNCQKQMEQYRRLSNAAGDKWDMAAQRCAECLEWLQNNPRQTPCSALYGPAKGTSDGPPHHAP